MMVECPQRTMPSRLLNGKVNRRTHLQIAQENLYLPSPIRGPDSRTITSVAPAPTFLQLRPFSHRVLRSGISHGGQARGSTDYPDCWSHDPATSPTTRTRPSWRGRSRHCRG